MPKQRTVELQFPTGGVDSSGAYHKHPPFYAVEAQNVRPSDVIEGRARGGSRPGIDKAFYEQIDSAAKVRLLDKVVLVDTSGYKTWVDDFEGATLGSDWTAASWLSAAPGVFPDDSSAVSTTNQDLGAVAPSLTIDSTNTHVIAMWINPWGGAFDGKYQIFGRMNSSSPDATNDGFVAELVMEDSTGTFSGTLKTYKNGSEENSHTYTTTASPIGDARAGWYIVSITSADVVTVSWLGNVLLNAQDISGDFDSDHDYRVGLGLEATQADGICLCGRFMVIYYDTVATRKPREILVASANGALYYENVSGMSALSTSLTLSANHRLESVDALQKLYIADYDPPVASGTDGVVSGASFDSATYADWTATNVDAQDHVVVISTAGSAGTFEILAIGAGNLALSTSPGDGSSLTFTIERAPKVYDPSAGTLALLTATAGKGQVPSGGNVIAYYRGRLCIAKDHACYQSRVDDPNDWLYSDTDDEGAVATTAADSTRGQIGDIFTALVPFKDDYLLYGCRNSIWLQVGDLRYGGEITNVTHHYGVLHGGHCEVPGGALALLTQAGLMLYKPGMAEPENISENRIPDDLKDINTDIYNVEMIYNHRDDGIHIFISGENATDRKHWWFDWGTKSFWPEDLQDNDEVFSVCRYNGHLVRYNAALTGSRNGYIKYYDSDFLTDGGTEITSYIRLGPFQFGGPLHDCSIDEIVATLAADSGDVAWSIRRGDTAQDASITTSDFTQTGTFTEGLNYVVRPRARGHALTLRLENNDVDEAWALEGLTMRVSQRGRTRKG